MRRPGPWMAALAASLPRLLLLLASLLILSAPLTAKGSGFQCTEGSSKSICLPDTYSKFDLPDTEKSNQIGVSIDIEEVHSINDKESSITFSTYFNVEWKEKRLELGASPKDIVSVDLELVKDLWLPNIFIYDLKTYKVIEVLSKLAGLWVKKDKGVLYSQATHISFNCPMRFDKFPLDKQICKFRFGSYSHDSSKMHFILSYAGYATKETNRIALDYAITIMPLVEEDTVIDYGPLGNFSVNGFEMRLTRYVSTYIISYYLPSGLLVIVSWISFLIPMDMVAGRMALLVTVFLVLVNIFNTVTTNTPKAECLTAIEAWMLTCILFVFGALTEYAAILLKKQRHVSRQHTGNQGFNGELVELVEVQEKSAASQAVTMQQLAEDYWRIDKFFLTAFPILFFVYNIIYWLMLVN